jgi:hypothetical protein
LFVKDLGSLNGTFINNLRIVDEQPLEPGQLLTLGNVTFRAVYEIGSPHSAQSAAMTDTQNVAYSGLDTAVVPPNGHSQPEPVVNAASHPAEPALPQNAFDETVPIDSMTAQDVAEARDKASSNKLESAADQCDSFDSDALSNSHDGGLAADTDKSFKTTYESDSMSNVFSFEGEKEPAEPSVSMSALEDLPSGQSAVSFVGDIEIGDEQKKPISKIEHAVELELGDEAQSANVDADSRLGSFLKKLPR